MLERYRPTMTEEVVHSWAKDAQNKLDNLFIVVSELRDTLAPNFKLSPEGREYLKKIDEVLNT